MRRKITLDELQEEEEEEVEEEEEGGGGGGRGGEGGEKRKKTQQKGSIPKTNHTKNRGLVCRQPLQKITLAIFLPYFCLSIKNESG